MAGEAVAAPTGFGGGLGAVIGANMANNHIDNALSSIEDTVADFTATGTTPYNNFGKSFLGPTQDTIGQAKAFGNDTLGYNEFMAGYENTPAAQYQLQQANAVQENSAASRGGLL